MAAKTAKARATWAQRGLASRGRLDRTVHAMLLRQLYLAHFERRAFGLATETVEGALDLGVLPDVLHQDAARAWVALGDVDKAATHLRTAARISPPSRKAFHWWTLGSMFVLARRYPEAIGALSRAARWGTRDKPLYRAHSALARLLGGASVPDLQQIIAQLRDVPAGRGYGKFVLGELAFRAGNYADARDDLRVFVDRTRKSRTAILIALEGEVAMAEATLERVERELAEAS